MRAFVGHAHFWQPVGDRLTQRLQYDILLLGTGCNHHCDYDCNLNESSWLGTTMGVPTGSSGNIRRILISCQRHWSWERETRAYV